MKYNLFTLTLQFWAKKILIEKEVCCLLSSVQYIYSPTIFNIVVYYIYENMQIIFTGKNTDENIPHVTFSAGLAQIKHFQNATCPIDQMFNDDINYYVLVLFRKNVYFKLLYFLKRK